jgi:hypothetical protein
MLRQMNRPGVLVLMNPYSPNHNEGDDFYTTNF